MKIVDRKKFRRSTTILMLIIIITIVFFTSKSMSHQDVKIKTIFVAKGDTLWNIARIEQNENKYFENKNINEIIFNIKEFNNFSNSNIYEGQEVLIPYI